jgi:nucleotide-binding universal stress UspA family protein
MKEEPMIQRILLAYDGSAASDKAATLAIDIALKYGAHISVISVARPPEVGDDVETEAVIENSRAFHKSLLEPLRKRFAGLKLSTSLDVLVGHPTEQIIAEAERQHVDLIVLGHRGKTLFQRFRLGSVSKQVVQYAECPVLVVR